MRNFLLFATTLLMALLANLTLTTQPSAAAADATWSGDNIVRTSDGATFTQDTGDQKRALHAPSDAAAVYVFAPAQASQVQVIFFPKGSDPASSKTAQFYIEPDVKNAKSISIEPKADPPLSATATATTTGCAPQGIGWIVCPVSNALASSVDYLYNIIAGFLRVEPLTADNSGVIYRGWSYMRNVANLAFVVAFLIIIYSQVTNVGISSYGIKKLLPRLVAAAILMNVSYWICAIAVDLSNITGYNLENMFIDLRHGMMGGANVEMPSWHEMTMTILAGWGTLLLGAHAIGVTSGGSIALLAPILVGVALSALVAIIILAARQAIITVLIIISPLAFVAFLLPNTEKYFKKWRETITSLLVMFPIFAVLFGGAQLAGSAIVLTAHGSIVELIFGLAVQVIPLAITPLILKFSGSLLSQVAGVVNNPKRGVIDRSRNWAKGVNERQTARGIAAGNKYARYYDHRRRNRDELHKQAQARGENIWAKTDAAKALHTSEHDIETAKKQIETDNELHLHARLDPKNTHFDRGAFEREMRLRTTSDQSDRSKQAVDTMYAEMRAGENPMHARGIAGLQTQAMDTLINDASIASQGLALEAMRKRAAEHVQQKNLSETLLQNSTDSTALIHGFTSQDYAGGIRGQEGADTALAAAVTERREAYGKAVAEAHQVVKHFNLDSAERQKLALAKGPVTKTDMHGNIRVFTPDDTYTHEAVIETQIEKGTVQEAIEIAEISGSTLAEFRTTIADSMAKSGKADKSVFLGGATINEIAKGTIYSHEDMIGIVQQNIVRGKFSADKVANLDKDAARLIVEAARHANVMPTTGDAAADAAAAARLPGAIEILSGSAHNAIGHRDLKMRIADNAKEYVQELADMVPHPPPPPYDRPEDT